MTLRITSFPDKVNPGAQVVIQGETDDCGTTTHTVSFNGNEVSHDWECVNGIFTITCTAPPIAQGQANILTTGVELGSESDSCETSVVPP
jgi:hypothetical protein